MAFWIISFEILISIFFILALIRALKKKNYRAFSTIIAGAIFGVLLEYLNIYLTQGYTYSQDFLFLVGTYPFHVPIMIGLAWGMLLQFSHEVSEVFNLPIFLRAIFAATFVVSIDLFSDVIAVRLDGGFWIWTDHPAVLTITNTDFMGIAYGNFYGWFFVIFLSSLVLHLFDAKFTRSSASILIMRTVVCIIGAEILLMAFLYLTTLFSNWVWLVFLIIYIGSILLLGMHFVKNKIHQVKELPDSFPLIYFVFLYLFNVVAMISLGLAWQIPFYFGLLVLYTIGVGTFLVKLTRYKNTTQDNTLAQPTSSIEP